MQATLGWSRRGIAGPHLATLHGRAWHARFSAQMMSEPVVRAMRSHHASRGGNRAC
jgi:hypothetical protein